MKNALLAAIALITALTCVALPRQADACLDRNQLSAERRAITRPCTQLEDQQVEVRARRAAETAAVLAATDHLNAGRNAEAISSLYEHFGNGINLWALNARSFTEREWEVVLIVALATLRANGEFVRDAEASYASESVARFNVKWAIIAMDGVAFMNYASERHLAEAWAKDPATQEAARDKLWGLYQAGRLASPFQFVTLAALLRQQGRDAEALAVLAIGASK